MYAIYFQIKTKCVCVATAGTCVHVWGGGDTRRNINESVWLKLQYFYLWNSIFCKFETLFKLKVTKTVCLFCWLSAAAEAVSEVGPSLPGPGAQKIPLKDDEDIWAKLFGNHRSQLFSANQTDFEENSPMWRKTSHKRTLRTTTKTTHLNFITLNLMNIFTL